MKKNVLALLLAIAMVISIVPIAALADVDHSTHEVEEYVYVGQNEHAAKCDCGEELYTDCEDADADGKCDACGHEMNHENELVSFTSNNNGTHHVKCSCGAEGDLKCVDRDDNGFCDYCKVIVKHKGAPHVHTYEAGVTSNLDGTHNINLSLIHI